MAEREDKRQSGVKKGRSRGVSDLLYNSKPPRGFGGLAFLSVMTVTDCQKPRR